MYIHPSVLCSGYKMPELSDQQLKDRVQKLENLLRVSGSFAFNVSFHERNGLHFAF